MIEKKPGQVWEITEDRRSYDFTYSGAPGAWTGPIIESGIYTLLETQTHGWKCWYVLHEGEEKLWYEDSMQKDILLSDV